MGTKTIFLGLLALGGYGLYQRFKDFDFKGKIAGALDPAVEKFRITKLDLGNLLLTINPVLAFTNPTDATISGAITEIKIIKNGRDLARAKPNDPNITLQPGRNTITKFFFQTRVTGVLNQVLKGDEFQVRIKAFIMNVPITKTLKVSQREIISLI